MMEVRQVEMPYSGGGPGVLFQNLKSFKKEQMHISHITGDIHYMSLVTGGGTVLTIHDIGSAFSGNFFKKLYIKVFWFWLPAILVRRITVISEFTKEELTKVIPFAKRKIRVVPNPVSSLIRYSSYSFNTDKPKVFLIGTKPNKNLERTLQALAEIDCEAMVLGKLLPEQEALIADLPFKVTNKIGLSYEEVLACYRDADLVCFASTYEGFGMPIIEAQATGRPVITANFGAMAEVAGEGACLVNPFDVGAIEEGIKKIIKDEGYRNELIALGLKNSERFKMERILEQYMEVYKEVIGEN
ncbi:hypothetical protein GCM10028791_39100 [Echinicola sediminis]